MVKSFFKVYDQIEAKVLVFSLIVTVLLIFTQIVMRSFFNNSLTWSEELARYIFIWQTWMGVSIGLKDDKHIRLEILYNYIHGRKAFFLRLLALLLSLFMCCFLVVYGWKMVMNAFNRDSMSAAMEIPLWTVYLSLPFSCLMTALRYLVLIKDQLFRSADHSRTGQPASVEK